MKLSVCGLPLWCGLVLPPSIKVFRGVPSIHTICCLHLALEKKKPELKIDSVWLCSEI